MVILVLLVEVHLAHLQIIHCSQARTLGFLADLLAVGCCVYLICRHFATRLEFLFPLLARVDAGRVHVVENVDALVTIIASLVLLLLLLVVVLLELAVIV